MAVSAMKMDTNLVIKFKAGIDSKGNDIIKKQTFSKTKITATDDDIYAVGAAIGGLLKFPVEEIERHDENLLMQE